MLFVTDLLNHQTILLSVGKKIEAVRNADKSEGLRQIDRREEGEKSNGYKK